MIRSGVGDEGFSMTGAAVLSVPVAEVRNAWDRQLVARMIAGDDSALADAYDQFGPLVHEIGRASCRERV